ncbi:hypothetical protein MRX96_050528 [Rhipicephalus microplus]
MHEVMRALKYEVPREHRQRLCFSVSLMGHRWTLRSSGSFHAGSAASQAGPAAGDSQARGVLEYPLVCQYLLRDSVDPDGMCSYAVRFRDWVAYEGVQSLPIKLSRMRRDMGTPGLCIAVWDLAFDDFRGDCGNSRSPLLPGHTQGAQLEKGLRHSERRRRRQTTVVVSSPGRLQMLYVVTTSSLRSHLCSEQVRFSSFADELGKATRPANAPRNAANWAGARFAETTTINSDSPDQLDCMDADNFEPTDNVGPSDSTPGPSGVAEASNNTYLRPSVPHTPWFRVIDARRKKVVAEEASATPPATFHQREHRHRTGRPRLPRLPVEDHKLPPNNQTRSRPQHDSSEGHGRSARSKRSKNPKAWKADLATYSTRSSSTYPGICEFIQELPTAFFAVQCEKLQYVASTPATRAHPCTWLGGQGSGLEFIWLGCRRSPRLSPTSQLQRRQDPLAVPGKSPFVQASQNPS